MAALGRRLAPTHTVVWFTGYDLATRSRHRGGGPDLYLDAGGSLLLSAEDQHYAPA